MNERGVKAVMKLIHCADIHLDSPMESNLPPEKARERKSELRNTFARLVRYAAESDVAAILISGDLFDSDNVTRSTEKYVLELIAAHPALRFFYLAGNHDRSSAFKHAAELPENLFLFDGGWKSYPLGEVVITGSERPDEDALSLEKDRINIVMLHGQDSRTRSKERGDALHLSRLKGKHVDYVALGHFHEYRTAKLDRRCTLCYSGCLEGRGFDECGACGYVLIEIENGTLTHRPVPFATRRMHRVDCDITGAASQLELEERILHAVEGIPAKDLVKVVLTGASAPDATKDAVHLKNLLSERFYFAKLSDESRLLLRAEDYEKDISLKGEFVRRVMASDLSEAEKERVIACGFRALMGEEIGL